MMLHTYGPNQCPYQVSTSYTIYGYRDLTGHDFIDQGHYDKVKSRSHHDFAHLQPQPMSLPSINLLHNMVSEIYPDKIL